MRSDKTVNVVHAVFVVVTHSGGQLVIAFRPGDDHLDPCGTREMSRRSRNPGRRPAFLPLTAPENVMFSPHEIYRRVWHEDPAADNPVAVHVRHIREKIEINPAEPRYLKGALHIIKGVHHGTAFPQ